MHVIIVAIGSAGDVYPFVAIGRAGLARGHRVSLATSPAFQTVVEAAGLRFLPIGTAAEYHAAMADPALWHPRTSLRTLWHVIAGSLHAQYELLYREAGDDAVILGSLWAFSARILQEKWGIPYLSAHVSPSTLLSAIAPPTHAGFSLPLTWPLAVRRLGLRLIDRWVLDPLMAPDVNRLRATLGLPRAHGIMTRWIHSPQGVLALYPTWFAPCPADVRASVSHVGFPLLDDGSTPQLDGDLQAFLDAGPPPVVVTAGSTGLQGTDFVATAVKAIGELQLRAVFLGCNEADRRHLPAHVVHRPRVPLAPLLERSAALVHHGGVGTAAYALAAGIPQVVTPFAHDQFDNAQRIVRLGCGLTLDIRGRPEALGPALATALGDPDLAAAAKQWRGPAQEDSGAMACERAVDALEICHSRQRLARRQAMHARREPVSDEPEAGATRAPRPTTLDPNTRSASP